MFDSCSFDKIIEYGDKEKLENSLEKDYEYFITSIQIEEICRIPDEEKRISIMLHISSMRPKIISTHSFVLGYARLGYARFGDSILYKQLLNSNKSNVKDAIIAETAIKEDCTLVTEDKDFIKIMKKNDYETISYIELTKLL